MDTRNTVTSMVVTIATAVSTEVATVHRHFNGLTSLNLMTRSPFVPVAAGLDQRIVQRQTKTLRSRAREGPYERMCRVA